MPGIKQRASSICARCLRSQSQVSPCFRNVRRGLRTSSRLLSNGAAPQAQRSPDPAVDRCDEEHATSKELQGAMSRRLEEMTSESLESNPRRAQKMVEEAGFSEELKKKLEARIGEGKFKASNAAAFAVADLPSSAGKGSRDIASAQPWTGAESIGDAALRMLDDAHKPLRSSTARPRRPAPVPVDLRLKNTIQQSAGERLANARDKTSIYSMSQDNSLSEKEKDDFRRILKERFQPGARPMPTSIQGLQSLASERIENAISRGLFKNIPRGKGVNVERDHAANSPFIDTTEYFMNKIIQKQEVLPPWVEKQQEVARTAAQFRSRLRNDWKRHAARVIASRGGSLEERVRRAKAYAEAEAIENPPKERSETISSVDTTGQLEQVTITETPATAGAEASETTISITPDHSAESASSEPVATHLSGQPTSSIDPPPISPPPRNLIIFRDAAWESTELPYHTLALSSLNSLLRSYNLMAPELAKKPYYSLQRELRSCFADVAPLLPEAIKERARAPARTETIIGHTAGGILERFSGDKVKVYESRRKPYGFKEFWRDLFKGKDAD